MEQLLTWLLENGATLLQLLVALVSAASLVTALTDTPKDDKVVSKIRSWLDRLSVLTHKNATGTVKTIGTKSK